MLEADLRDAIRDANDLGHFFLLMEHKGYEIHHGGRLGFRLRGQEKFQYPGRRDPLFTEDGIRAAIQGNLEQIEAGLRPVLPVRPAYQPYRKHPKYSGFLALYILLSLSAWARYEKRHVPAADGTSSSSYVVRRTTTVVRRTSYDGGRPFVPSVR